VFKNRLTRRIFGFKRNELTRDCRKLHDKELHNLEYLVGMEREMISAYEKVFRKPEARRRLWTPRRR
jgi:hypothetical protein